MDEFNADVPEDLMDAFRRLGGAVTDLWPQVAERMKAKQPADYADLREYIARGGQIRAVVQFSAPAAVVLEFAAHTGEWTEFYRVEAQRSGPPVLLN